REAQRHAVLSAISAPSQHHFRHPVSAQKAATLHRGTTRTPSGRAEKKASLSRKSWSHMALRLSGRFNVSTAMHAGDRNVEHGKTGHRLRSFSTARRAGFGTWRTDGTCMLAIMICAEIVMSNHNMQP
ncbi:MAG: hypothetical protein ACI87T_001399, partial [Planctomycetota bacterium]